MAGFQPTTASAQTEYPTRQVSIVVPLAPGTGMDSIARLYAEPLQRALGRPVVIENQPGASMMIASSAVARANPDGHTLLVASGAPLAINPFLFKKINYDPLRDFTPLAFYVRSPFILVVNTDLPVKTVAELVALAKTADPPLTYSSPGVGLAQHLTMEFLKQKYSIDITHVPYRSTPQSVTDIIAGHVKMAVVEAGASLQLIREGKLRALAVSSATRLPQLPDVPTFAEAASEPGYEAVSWHMLLAPAATPRDVAERLRAEMARITSTEDFKAKIIAIGLIPVEPQPAAEMAKFLVAEQQKWVALVRRLGLEGSQ